MTIQLLICVILMTSSVVGYTPAELKAMLQVGLSNIDKETIDGKVTVDHGAIPDWLHGNFLRHACSAFGETANQDESGPNYIQHLFDCIEAGSKFKLVDGAATFTNRHYDTITEDIYSVYDRDMNESSVFMSTIFSKQNVTKRKMWADNMTGDAKVVDVPHVSWWQIGDDAIAMSESPIGVIIDPESMTQQGEVQYTDNWFGYRREDGWQYTNNPAHEQTEPDGTLWSTVGVYKFTNRTTIDMRRLVYKVGADKHRHLVGEHQYNTIDLSKCGPGSYKDHDARLGYLHSFCMTDEYIILPETAYMFDPCFMTRYDAYEPFFLQGFTFENNGFSRLLVMRRSDGQFIAEIKTVPFFVTHQLGAYEDGELIHMDMLMYDDAGIYDRHTYVNSLLGDNPYLTNVSRISINTTDWTASIRNLRKGPPAALEMSNINYAYYGKKYTYAYMAKNFDQIFTNAITKLNVDTGEETDYLLEDGFFVQEPQFIAKPGAVYEDDGIIMAQGVDGRKKKAFLVIVDAKTMQRVAHVTAPDLALLGIHERFYPIDVTGGTAARSGSFLLALLMACAAIVIFRHS